MKFWRSNYFFFHLGLFKLTNKNYFKMINETKTLCYDKTGNKGKEKRGKVKIC